MYALCGTWTIQLFWNANTFTYSKTYILNTILDGVIRKSPKIM